MTQRACRPPTPHSGIRFNVRSENHFLVCRLRHNSLSDSPTPGCTATWGRSRMAQGCSARRCHLGTSVHDSMGTTNESMSKVSSCQRTSGSMSPKISSADLPRTYSLRGSHWRPPRTSFHEWSTIQWRRWESNPRPPACKAGALAN